MIDITELEKYGIYLEDHPVLSHAYPNNENYLGLVISKSDITRFMNAVERYEYDLGTVYLGALSANIPGLLAKMLTLSWHQKAVRRLPVNMTTDAIDLLNGAYVDYQAMYQYEIVEYIYNQIEENMNDQLKLDMIYENLEYGYPEFESELVYICDRILEQVPDIDYLPRGKLSENGLILLVQLLFLSTRDGYYVFKMSI